MDYTKKIEKIEKHLENHPQDAQSQVALLIARSNQYEHERYVKQISKLKEIAKWRAIFNE